MNIHRLAGFPPFMGESLPEIVEQIMSADFDFPGLIKIIPDILTYQLLIGIKSLKR